ncbi:serine/threonine protein kinase [Luteolibacter arcticus]|uniref:Serine/threonine protein kinase n=1 Tax=Luteolibacter arcticus TaxID=1581411 RepID=A0ABT3GLK3_9BACT|nr:serine/threonine-protein kinase [Luteolibacter arcticus]MCW1924391.1 serine/threonine protein kinase [Luteolibacter arcticus]
MSKDNPHEEEISGAIMEVALSLDHPEARQAFLNRVFPNGEAEKEEMSLLLEATDEAATFFLEAREQRAKVTATILSETQHGRQGHPRRFVDDDAPPEKFGPYRLIARLGEGGGGVVYEAEQDHPIRRRVALKIVRMDVGNKGALARFDIERQALALMDHPNIAKVFDAGTTPSGKPYFAMELVTGEPITSYCNLHKLDSIARLELFVLVCNAIQHAHQKGVIHRDIKPSNVIVTLQDGAHLPKIIDFGIAKASSTGESITAHDQFFGTPAYMSPEQVAMTGIDVDTRSDIFSLGVLLYELLTGSTPLDRSTGPDLTFSQIRKSLLTSETLRPSEHLAKLAPEKLRSLAEERSTQPAGLTNQVKGDLDWIVMMALERNRMRRYQTANGLAIDIKRFLTQQPIAAHPPSKAYVLAKFVRRNRLAFGAAVMVVTLLVGGLATTATLYERERKAAMEQLRLKNEAQAARYQENRLRLQADARSNISRIAFLLDQGLIDEADALRQQYPLSSIEPSLEAAAVFRSLGDWNAEHGRWDHALQCYQRLRQANQYGSPQKIINGQDLMAIAAALLTRDPKAYSAFREEVMVRYAPAIGQINAEHLLKVCLVHPAEPRMLKALRRDVDTLGDPRSTPYPAWAALSLSLYHLRAGDCGHALRACQTGLASPERKSSCESSLEAVSAMVFARMGSAGPAKEALTRAREISKQCDGKDFAQGLPVRPCWFDWAIADLLIKEAGLRVQAISR